MVSHRPIEFGLHRHCGSGYILFLVMEGQDSTCPLLDPPLLFISKTHDIHAHTQNFKT